MHIAFSKNRLRLVIAVILALVLEIPSPIPAEAQNSNVTSRAEQEAEQQVSLSPEKIIEVLRDEPGLLLQLKKLLVRQAFADGRILNASDLSDDALYRLLWEDENARVLATREIEDRDYIRAKPTHEEIERERDLAAQRGLSRTSMSTRQFWTIPFGCNITRQNWSGMWTTFSTRWRERLCAIFISIMESRSSP